MSLDKRPRAPAALIIIATLIIVVVFELAFLCVFLAMVGESVRDMQTTQNYFYGRRGD